MARLTRQGSIPRISYPHASLSSVVIDGQASGVADGSSGAPADIDVIMNAAPIDIQYNFNAERLILDNIATSRAERLSLAEARQKKKDLAARIKDKLDEAERVRLQELAAKELQARAAADATRLARVAAEQERLKAEAEINAKREEAKLKRRLIIDAELAEKLSPEQRQRMTAFESIAGDSTDFTARIKFLERYNWDVEKAIAGFFEYDGNVANVPPSPTNPPQVPKNRVTIDFQFPDKSTESAEFSSTDTLWMIFEFVYGRASRFSAQRGFSLSSPGRKTVYAEAEFDGTLQELGLVPRGKIIIVAE